jgi:hypothetical protein
MLTVSKEIRSWSGVDTEKFNFSNPMTRPVFHQNDLIPRFFTHVLLLRVPKPYGQGITSMVMENLYPLHAHSPSLIASVG